MIEKTLTPEQLEAINEIERNLQIIACAGSGKTEVITRRIAKILQNKPEIAPKNIVAFTFTEKAATEMKNRIEKLTNVNSEEMYVGTIHGFCYYLLNEYTEKFKEYKIIDSVKNHLFIQRYYKECGMSDLELEPYPRNFNLFLECIEKMIDDYENRENWDESHRQVIKKYIDCLYSHKYIDFSLLLFETVKQIKENPFVKEYLSHIKYLVVDEYQDVNDIQEALISLIAEQGANICVVGDDDQTIYQFRGSNASNMISFSERYDNVHQVKLEKNFRCVEGIVDIADCVIRNNNRRISKKMVSNNAIATEITAKRYSDKTEQYNAIAEKIEKLHSQGVPYKEMAILVRKGKVIVPISTALDRKEIPFETDSAEHFFGGNYFNRFVTTLKILAEVDKAKLYECWQDIIDADKFNIGFKFLRSCSRGGNSSLGEIVYGFCEKIEFLSETALDIDDRQIDLDGIVKILNDYDEIYGDWQLSARIKGILNFLATQAADEYKYHSFKPRNPNSDSVQIMTVHKAKGLEFNTVFLPELIKREFPVFNIGGKKYWHILGGCFEENKDKYQSDVEDERKLFYVAVTRAKQNLYMTYELSSQPVSCFVAESASSVFLGIDKSDISYNPKANDEYKTFNIASTKEMEATQDKPDWKEERRLRQEYWENVKYARSQLYDYYGTGAHFCPAMYSMLAEIKTWSPEKILEEASKI